MEESSNTPGMKRNLLFSRRLSTVGGNSFRAKWIRVLFVFIVLCLGLVCGNFVYRLIFAEKNATQSTHFKRHNVHEPPDSRPGLSIKKDMSIQFRDYLPRHIFITSGSWYQQRSSLNLFLKTYPNARDYHLYCSILDNSERHFFTPFRKITIIEGQLISATNKTVETQVNKFGGGNSTKKLSAKDFAAWLIETFHQDDYIIVKMDSANETDIAHRLRKTGALDWIDKYYTSTTDNATLSEVRKVFKEMNVEPLAWDDNASTYDDLHELNPVDGPKTTTSVFKTCGYYESFLVVFYVPFVSKQALFSLEVLKSFASPSYLKTALFLSPNFISSQQELTESLIHSINVGIYMVNKTKEDSVKTYNNLKNDFIEIWRIFKEFSSNPVNLRYVLSEGFNDEINSKLSDERFVDVFTDVLDINHVIPDFVNTRTIEVGDIKRNTNQVFAVDLTGEDSEMLMVYILTKYKYTMLSVESC